MTDYLYFRRWEVDKILAKRYERNIKALSEKENKMLFEKNVCIVGCGGLGGYIIEILSRIGIGNITVVDGDVFEESNLNRQILSDMDSLGKNKAEKAGERINKINPDVKVKVIKEFLDNNNYKEIIAGSDIVVDALDNIETKKMLQDFCREAEIILVHGAIGGWYGQVITIFPNDNTLDFLYRETENNGIEKILGNLPFTASTVASIQCSEVVKVLTCKGDIFRKKVLFIDLMNNEWDLVETSG